MFLGHIYIGTIGMRGAYSAMRNGYVDEGWAQEHHELWYDDIRPASIPAQRSAERRRPPRKPPPDRASQDPRMRAMQSVALPRSRSPPRPALAVRSPSCRR